MSARLLNKVTLITGASSGIGRAAAELFAKERATVIVADVQDDLGKQVVETIKKAGGNAIYKHLDVSSEDAWKNVVSDIKKDFGKLDVLVNNAGIGDTLPIENVSLKEYEKVIGITQTSVFLGQKTCADLLKASGKASVINVSSMFGIVGGFGASPAYHCAKGAVRCLTKSTAIGWAKQGVRVNSVHPGFVETPILGEIDRAALAAAAPMGRVAKPEELAGPLVFLASDESSFITGAELVVDGGYTAQ